MPEKEASDTTGERDEASTTKTIRVAVLLDTKHDMEKAVLTLSAAIAALIYEVRSNLIYSQKNSLKLWTTIWYTALSPAAVWGEIPLLRRRTSWTCQTG